MAHVSSLGLANVLNQYDEKYHGTVQEALGWLRERDIGNALSIESYKVERAFSILTRPKESVPEIIQLAMFLTVDFERGSGGAMSLRSSPMSGSFASISTESVCESAPLAVKRSAVTLANLDLLNKALSSGLVALLNGETYGVADAEFIYTEILDSCGGDEGSVRALLEEVQQGKRLVEQYATADRFFGDDVRIPLPTGVPPCVELNLKPLGYSLKYICEFQLKDQDGKVVSEPFNSIFEMDSVSLDSKVYLERAGLDLLPQDNQTLAETKAQVAIDLDRNLQVTLNGEVFKASAQVEEMYEKILFLTGGDETQAHAYLKLCQQGATAENIRETRTICRQIGADGMPMIEVVQAKGLPYSLSLNIDKAGLKFQSTVYYQRLAVDTAVLSEPFVAFHVIDEARGFNKIMWTPTL